MIFTDKDLKRLKYWIEKRDDLIGPDYVKHRDDCVLSIRPLIARLEAAENVASYAKDAPITLLERWLTTTGKAAR